MLLALDLATRIGWCCGRGERLPVVGSYQLDAQPNEIGAFLSEFELWLAGVLTEVEPEMVIFESPAPAGFNSLSSIRKTLGLAGVTEMVCYRRNIEAREIAPASVKKGLSGNGRAKKPEMMAAARAYGIDPKFHDEADAFGIWLCAVRQLRREHAARWDPINFARAS